MRARRFLGCLLLLLCLGQPAPGAELSVSPAPGETVAESRPVISVQLPADGALRHEGARLWVNGHEVTGSCLRTPMFVSYQAPGEMAEGEVQVRFQARSADGQPVEQSWSFQVRPPSRITSVVHDAEGELGEYDELAVEMTAEPGGRAWFEIEGLVAEVPMAEGPAGLYRGTYHVKSGDYRLKARVLGHLELGPRSSALPAGKPVSIFGHLFRVKILEPANGAQVPQDFILRGRTRPHARISVVPKIGFDDGMAAATRDAGGGQTGTIPAEADGDGNFSVHYGLPLTLPNMQVVLTVTATDAEGNRSIPTMLRVRF